MNRPAFAHASEAELARILDYYQVAWAYEPRAFPILFDLQGRVLESFAPDFYLPELDLYVELTTLKQSLVRRKNRKLRRLRELYPDVRVKLFYARDFKALLIKYGRLELARSLTGADGQAVLEAAEAVEPAAGLVELTDGAGPGAALAAEVPEGVTSALLAAPSEAPVAADAARDAAERAAHRSRRAAARRIRARRARATRPA